MAHKNKLRRVLGWALGSSGKRKVGADLCNVCFGLKALVVAKVGRFWYIAKLVRHS